MNQDQTIELLTKKIDESDMRAVWFPRDWQKIIVRRAKAENLPIYKYLMMLSNNHQILKDETRKSVEVGGVH
jgi:hypothetical protein